MTFEALDNWSQVLSSQHRALATPTCLQLFTHAQHADASVPLQTQSPPAALSLPSLTSLFMACCEGLALRSLPQLVPTR